MKKTAKELYEAIKDTGIVPAQTWRHYKGEVYSIDLVTIDCNTNEPVIVYHNINTPGSEPIIQFSRPYSEWNTEISPIGTQRFVRVRAINELVYYTDDELIQRGFK